ncbi:MAG: hypothetical protein SFY81_05815 [Verrucomicrobiota bacterium]|nr:hypothetical protein [Verrucomicrobiota bacterium]
MNHPSPEEWIDFLYEEIDEKTANRLKKHLHDCSQCRAQLNQWEQSRALLNRWKIEVPHRPASLPAWMQWAAAVLILFSVGYFSGKEVHSAANQEQRLAKNVKAEIQAQLAIALQAAEAQWKQDVSRQFEHALLRIEQNAKQETAAVLAAAEKAHGEETSKIYSIIATLEQQRIADLSLLRKELETVALNAEDGFSKAQRQMIQLANYQRPATSIK